MPQLFPTRCSKESVERINAHVQEVDDNISGARRVMIQMYRRAMARSSVW